MVIAKGIVVYARIVIGQGIVVVYIRIVNDVNIVIDLHVVYFVKTIIKSCFIIRHLTAKKIFFYKTILDHATKADSTITL